MQKFAGGVEKLNDEKIGAEVEGPIGPQAAEEVLPQVEQGSGIDFGVLKARTGPGQVADYIDHPMNFDRSEGFAQVLRGLTGLVGDLGYAVVDIIIGIFRWFKGRKVSAAITE